MWMLYVPLPLSTMSLWLQVHAVDGLQLTIGSRPGPHGFPLGSAGLMVTTGSPAPPVIVVVGLEPGWTPTSTKTDCLSWRWVVHPFLVSFTSKRMLYIPSTWPSAGMSADQ